MCFLGAVITRPARRALGSSVPPAAGQVREAFAARWLLTRAPPGARGWRRVLFQSGHSLTRRNWCGERWRAGKRQFENWNECILIKGKAKGIAPPPPARPLRPGPGPPPASPPWERGRGSNPSARVRTGLHLQLEGVVGFGALPLLWTRVEGIVTPAT